MYNVYLLDDEEWILEGLYHSIPWFKYNVNIIGRSTNSLEAYKEIKYWRPDIVMTDVRMPDMNGLELIEKLTNEGCESVFIIITGHAEFEYVKKAMSFNVVGYCLKPFDDDEVIEVLLKAEKLCEDKKILTALYTAKDVDHKSNNKTFLQVCDYIKDRFKEDISLQEIADYFHINASYLSNLFSKEMGLTYSKYVMSLRLHYAKELLVNTELTINDISEQCGFKNYAYFARIFRRNLGLSPTNFREENKNQY